MYEMTISRIVMFIFATMGEKKTLEKDYFDQFQGIQHNNLSGFPIKYLTYADTLIIIYSGHYYTNQEGILFPKCSIWR